MALTQITRDNQIKPGTAYNWVTNDSSGKMSQTAVTASSAVASDSNGLPVASSTTSTELAGLHGLTANSIVATNGSGILTTLTNPLTVSNGGTGNSTLTAHAVLLGEGTSAVAFAGPGTIAYPLVSNGASSDPSFQQLSLTAGVTGTLPIANGGTNSNASLTNGFVMASNGGKIVTNPASNALSMNGGQLNFVADPTAAQDAATKNYVDMTVNGLTWKSPVYLATAAALPAYTFVAGGTPGIGDTITINATGTLTIDGVVTALNERILVKDETAGNAPYNGIYKVTTAGAVGVQAVLTRATDSNTAAELEAGTAAFATAGSTNANKGFTQTATVTTVDTDPITYITFTSAVSSYFAGAGLDLSGATFSISTDTSLTANAANSVPSLVVNFNTTGGIYNNSGVSLKLADNSLQTASGGASVKLNAAGALTTTATGLQVNTDGTTTHITSNNVAVIVGNLTDAGTDGITITSGTGAVVGSGTSISQHVADTTHNGYLSSTDWNTFNGKLSTTLTSAHIFVGNGSNVATDTAVTGDVSITNAGVTSISNGLATHFVTREAPTGSINGSNTVFNVANTVVSGTECVYLNGLLQNASGNDYTFSGTTTITFTVAPESGSVILVNYQK